jgi:hypothetical protein
MILLWSMQPALAFTDSGSPNVKTGEVRRLPSLIPTARTPPLIRRVFRCFADDLGVAIVKPRALNDLSLGPPPLAAANGAAASLMIPICSAWPTRWAFTLRVLLFCLWCTSTFTSRIDAPRRITKESSAPAFDRSVRHDGNEVQRTSEPNRLAADLDDHRPSVSRRSASARHRSLSSSALARFSASNAWYLDVFAIACAVSALTVSRALISGG